MKLATLVLVIACVGGVSSFISTFRPIKSTLGKATVGTRVQTVVTSTSSNVNYLESSSKAPWRPSSEESERRVKLLDDCLGFNASAASVILDDLAQLRKLSAGASQEQVETYVDSLLCSVEGGPQSQRVSLPWWTSLRPLARFSRRARRASLRRVLDLSTPTAMEEDVGDDPNAEKRKMRRSLVVLIRALASMTENDNVEKIGDTGFETSKKGLPAIVQLERIARREARSKPDDLAQRLPPGLETPIYSVLVTRPPSKGGYEVRRYEPFTVCSVSMEKPRPQDATKTDAQISNPQLAGASAFGALAGYLFGKNQDSTAMKMTTPVLSQGEGMERKMAFVLPSEFWKDGGLDFAPKPLDGSGVTLERKDGGERAVLMFGGFAGKNNVDERTKQLLDGLSNDKDWRVVSGANVTLAQYNDPFTPPWKRRNEVSVDVISFVKPSSP